MKKIIALILALTVLAAVFAGCGKQEEIQETVPTTAPVEEPTVEAVPEQTAPAATEEQPQDAPASASALAVLEKVWTVTSENEKFPCAGGDAGNMVDGAPGTYSLADPEALTAQLLVPAEQVANIDDAAALFHGMMLNNFTCGVFHVTGDVDAFVEAMYGAIKNNQWMCGFPETMIIAVVDGEYVLAGFGINDIMKTFVANVKEAHQYLDIVYLEAIA